MSSTEPLVTIAIPTFNRAAWLPGCVETALAQSYQRFEVLVSDNASTDATSEILSQISDPRVRVLRQSTNVGQIPNWNACLAEAKGDYVVFVSDDDRIAPSLLERCVTLVKGEPQVQVVAALSDVYFCAEDRTWHAPQNRKLATGIWDGADLLKEYFEDRISTPMCSIMINTESLRARDGFPLDFPFAGDTIAWVSLLLSSRAGLINESCGTVCVHTGNETSKLELETRLNCLKKLVDFVSDETDRSMADVRRRRALQSAAKRYFARYAVQLIASYRKAGTRLLKLVPVLWHLRSYLRCIQPQDIARMARPLAVLVLPSPVTRWARSIRLTWPNKD
ncbi:glycosyltransferase family 2 protein [Bradyrhizobium sp. 182]|uniref:glycosyltransferase family 2 protein n=1 Tax=unclassified Bradyrhizobium TaxID=2631580 RepID=UPI001FF9D02B|nr:MULTISPECIES: glycosyltransferase family 2 protein [unclassified Bradyrhizobium]MCK1424836.1 glycosyltransferase family 2 protein [Bradyrhizobium sp. CW12]MCK1531866.1 glycosyltransferase family 2 protein [Bradyrhizobium sp. 182]MCK1646517.1 glycosyltransferase family 2 protein [Bradyrhizobium sp. 154]